jgi:hypothetical protein
MVPSGRPSLLTTGPGPDGSCSKVNQSPHIPNKSGIDAAFSLAPVRAAAVGAACPKVGVSVAAASVTTKRQCCVDSCSCPRFVEFRRELSHKATLLLPSLPQPRNRLPQCISEAEGFVMRDAGQCDQLCVHTGLLKLRNSRRRRVKRYRRRANESPEPEAATRRPMPAACRRLESPR